MKTIPTSITANEFGTSADKVEPSPSLESAGYIPSQQLPAEHMNWFMSLLTRLANADNPSLRDLWSELNTILTAAGLSADNATVTQVKAALDVLYLLKTAYGTNWLTTIQTALGANWQTALAATAGSGILTELKKVDGIGSGLDADLIRGVTLGSNWATALSATAGDGILTELKKVDGAESGLSADTVRGQVMIDFQNGQYGISGTWSMSGSSSMLIPKGTYVVVTPIDVKLSIYYDGDYSWHTSETDFAGGVIVSDGSAYRLTNSSSTTRVAHYRKLLYTGV